MMIKMKETIIKLIFVIITLYLIITGFSQDYTQSTFKTNQIKNNNLNTNMLGDF